MKYKIAGLLACAVVSGCATSLQQTHNGDIDIVAQKLQQQPAEVYLAQLHKQKQLFLQKMQAAALAEKEPTPIDCQAIANGDWASSVRFGQAFLPYANHVATVARCYKEGQTS